MKFTWGIFNSNGDPITGGSSNTSIKVRRESDSYLLDWNDMTFKNSGWTTLSSTMTEIDATNLSEYYEKIIDVTSWNNGFYQIFTRYTVSPKQNGMSYFLLRGGGIDLITQDIVGLE